MLMRFNGEPKGNFKQLHLVKEIKMDYSKMKALVADKKQSMKKFERTAKVDKPGKNRIRLLPGWRKGEEHVWFHDFGQHFIKDASDKIQAVYVCAAATFDRPCAVCSAMSEAGRHVHDDETQKILEKSKSGRVVLVNALMLDSDTPNTPQVLELKRSVFSQIIEAIEEHGGPAIFDPVEGYEIIINRDGKGLNTTYFAQKGGKQYKVPPAALNQLNDLDEYVKQESEEQSRKAVAAINSIAGILPAPRSGSAAARLAAPKDDFEDVPDFAEATAKTAVRADVALDDELDDLLAEM